MTHPLKAYRIAKNMSLEELAALARSSTASLSRIENGRQEPSLALIRRLKEVTDGAVAADDFIRADQMESADEPRESRLMSTLPQALSDRGLRIRLARDLGITPGAIYQWRRVPAERVIQVERLTGIPRHDLRPDLYPADEPARAAE